MGTRNMTLVYKDGDCKLSKYCQWDGYPEGQGATALAFLREEFSRSEFETALDKLKVLTEDEIEKLWEKSRPKGDKTAPGFVSMEHSKKMAEKYPQFQRDCGAEILSLVQRGKVKEIEKPDISFCADSLFCEWAYVLDLDKNTFEVYKGFNTSPLDAGERFASLPLNERNVDGVSAYYPIKFAASWTLDALPTKEEFLEALKEPEEEEEEVA